MIKGTFPYPGVRGSRHGVVPCGCRVQILTLWRVQGAAAVIQTVVGVGENFSVFCSLEREVVVPVEEGEVFTSARIVLDLEGGGGVGGVILWGTAHYWRAAHHVWS